MEHESGLRVVERLGGLAGMLKQRLSLREGVLYPNEWLGSEATLRQKPISQRCEIIGGDFFKGVQTGADAYVLKGIIHDWNDEAALKILKNCRPAIRSDGTLLIVEAVLTPR